MVTFSHKGTEAQRKDGSLTSLRLFFVPRNDRAKINSDRCAPSEAWCFLAGESWLMKISQTELPIMIPFLFHLFFLT